MDETVEEKYLKNLRCFHVPNFKACFYGTCAPCCVTGLMIQQVNRKSVEKSEAGFCGCCYFESCYPCVITDDCCTYSACFAILSALPCLAILNVFQFCTNWTVRRELIEKASGERPGCFSTTFHRVMSFVLLHPMQRCRVREANQKSTGYITNCRIRPSILTIYKVHVRQVKYQPLFEPTV